MISNAMQDEQYLIDRELGAATLECLDPLWEQAQLTIELAGGAARVALAPLGCDGVGVPSDATYAAIDRLVTLHQEHATELLRATYTFRRRADGKWSFVADYVYLP